MEPPNIASLSHELLCQIIQFLPLKETLSIAMLCKKLSDAVGLYLRLCKSIDFSESEIYGYMPRAITDDHIHTLLKKCPKLEVVHGLNPVKVERRRLRKRSALTVPGIIEALCLCPFLKQVETSDLRLLEGILVHLPHLEIIGNVRNRGGIFPPQVGQRLKLPPYPRITSLHLIGVEVPELTAMPELQHLHLQWVRFTKLHPFRAFMASNLQTFVMKHCIGPAVPMRYLSLFIALSAASELTRLELVRVPLPGGLIQRAIEDTWKNNGFRKLRRLVIGACKGILESDLGHLMIVSSLSLQSLCIQPTLTKDSLFVSLFYAHCDFSNLSSLHLGYVDDFPKKGEWSNDYLLTLGLADVPEIPSSLTDSGMKVVSQLFPNVYKMSVSHCPHLMTPDKWITEGERVWSKLNYLMLQGCHCLRLTSFALFLALLSDIETVILVDMFREPPKGCSHVGLSAGTGLGMSSAVVSNQDEHIAVQGHQQDILEQPLDDQENVNEDDEIQVDDIEVPQQAIRVEPQPHFFVLQEQLFDDREENHGIMNIPDAEEAASHLNEVSLECNEDSTCSSYAAVAGPSNSTCSKNESLPESKKVNTVSFNQKSSQNFSLPCSSSSLKECADSSNNSSGFTGSGKIKNKNELQGPEKNVNNNGHQEHPVNTENLVENANSNQNSSYLLQQPSTSKLTDQERLESLDEPPNAQKKLCSNTFETNELDLYSGPLTRHRKRILSGQEVNQKDAISQGTQATSDDIRRCLAQQKMLNSTAKNCQPSKNSSLKSNSSCKRTKGASEKQNKKKTACCKKEQQHKSTSTSDPLLEDDAVQVLKVVSETLISLTVVNCGISDIVIDHCYKLMHLEVQACRIMKKISFCHCPSVSKISISQCPKIELPHLVSVLTRLVRNVPTITYIEPGTKDYIPWDIERSILCNMSLLQNFVLIHDFGSRDDDRGAYRQNLNGWLKLFSLLISCVLSKQLKSLSLTKQKSDEKYPWGHHLHRLFGSLQDGSYELLTNNPLLASAWNSDSTYNNLCIAEPQSLGFISVSDLITYLKSDIADWVQTGHGTNSKFLAFYIHVPETNLSNRY